MTRDAQPDLAPLLTDLESQFGPRARQNESLATHTMFRLGGPADIWFPANSADELALAVSLARQHDVPVFLLGGGANLLVTDAGIRGLAIENRAGNVRFAENMVHAESGVGLIKLAKQCARRSLSGLEWAIGIPGTLGGAVVNNAGAYGGSMAGNLVRAELLTADGQRQWQTVDWFAYGYRASKIKRLPRAERPIVLQAELALTPAPSEEILAQMNAFNERRKTSQPPGATLGSMFKNPPDDHAGRLIEAAGLKGHRLGEAQISPIHANFFVNLGHARADDVIGLIRLAQTEVAEKFGVTLELEIEIVD